MNLLKKILPTKKPKIKTFGNEIATEAFKHGGHTYYQFQDNFKLPTGRAICSLAIYSELQMRCTDEYLRKHCEATDIILNGGNNGKVRLTQLAQINNNLKERLNLAPFPDHIYKLASVIFFDETESPYSYDFEYNQKKIAAWKKDGDLLYFFFECAVQGFDAVWQYVQRTCSKLFQHNAPDRPITPSESPRSFIQKTLDNWFDQMNWLADKDVVKLKAVSEMPMFDFFIMLNKKIEETEKQIARNKRAGKQ